MTDINGYHAHVYYDSTTKPRAERLAEAIGGDTLRRSYRPELLPTA